MSSDIKLSEGAITTLLAGGTVTKPIFQMVSFKKVPGANNTERYRLLVSDGRNSHPFAMLATQLNEKINSGEMDSYCVIQVDKHICNVINGDKRVLIILEATVLKKGSTIGAKIGNPIACTPSNSSEQPPASASNPPVKMEHSSKMERSFETPEAKRMKQSSMAPVGTLTRNVFPIESLNPYQNRWTICARVTSKSGIRTWSNSRGEGRLFNVTLVDESGEIRATGFNEQCDTLYDLLEVNKVFYISNANLKQANKAFNNLSNNYELSFRNDTSIEPCNTDCSNVPVSRFDFTKINELQNKPKDAMIDVIGVCKSFGDVQSLTARATNRELKKRELQIVDQTETEINLTLWGDEAEKFDGYSNPVVAVKGARVSDFGGCSLSLTHSSCMTINPDIHEAHALRGWFDKGGNASRYQSLSTGGGGFKSGGDDWKCLSQITSDNLGMGDKPDYYSAVATVFMIRKENCLYQACPSEKCNKKVSESHNGLFRCEKCNKEFEGFKWRILLTVNIADFSGNQWVTCFQEMAEEILGKNANELGQLQKSNETEFQACLNEANFKSFNFKLRTKMESYNDENRLKTTGVSVTPINYIERNKRILAELKNAS